ncbi:MAG: hypothetical protein U0133_22345 [Gemmatimonadales bacterium]
MVAELPRTGPRAGVAPSYADIRRRMESDRAEAIMHAERAGRRAVALVIAVCVAWYALGILLILASYHIGRPSRAQVALWGGISLCFAGPFFTWVVAYTLGREHGYWG